MGELCRLSCCPASRICIPATAPFWTVCHIHNSSSHSPSRSRTHISVIPRGNRWANNDDVVVITREKVCGTECPIHSKRRLNEHTCNKPEHNGTAATCSTSPGSSSV